MDKNTREKTPMKTKYNNAYQLVDECISGCISLRWSTNRKGLTTFAIFIENNMAKDLGTITKDEAISSWNSYPKGQPHWTYLT